MIAKRDCKATKDAIDISNHTNCEDAAVFMKGYYWENVNWENDDEDSTMCTVSNLSMTESDCPGSLQETSCGQSYDYSMIFIGMASETCDMIIPDAYVSFGNYFTNIGCCASISNCFA